MILEKLISAKLIVLENIHFTQQNKKKKTLNMYNIIQTCHQWLHVTLLFLKWEKVEVASVELGGNIPKKMSNFDSIDTNNHTSGRLQSLAYLGSVLQVTAFHVPYTVLEYLL
jgi:hypothetical protein